MLTVIIILWKCQTPEQDRSISGNKTNGSQKSFLRRELFSMVFILTADMADDKMI